MYIVLEYSLFLPDINENRIFSTYFQKNLEISSLMKIRLVGAELFHADGRTDGRTAMTKIRVAFRNFPKAPKKLRFFPTGYIYCRPCGLRVTVTVNSINRLACD